MDMNNVPEVAAVPDINPFFDEYAHWTDATAKYPINNEPHYLVMGATNEAAELIEKLIANPIVLNPNAPPVAVDTAVIIPEVGDVLWYLARYTYRVLRVSFALMCHEAVVEFEKDEPESDILFVALGGLLGFEKKRIRDGASWDDNEVAKREAFARQFVKRAVAQLVKLGNYLEFSLEDAMLENQRKLTARLEADTIQGDGDNR